MVRRGVGTRGESGGGYEGVRMEVVRRGRGMGMGQHQGNRVGMRIRLEDRAGKGLSMKA